MIESVLVLGSPIYFYDLINILGVAAAFIFGDCWCKKYSFGYLKSFAYVVFAMFYKLVLVYATAFVVGWGTMAGLNHIRVVILLPVLMLPICRMLKNQFWEVTDFIAPVLAISHSISCIACVFPGCCHGYPSALGIYSNAAGTVCFPIQLVEATANLLIGIVLCIMICNKVQSRRIYSWYLILFGGMRFLLEFMRDDEKLLFGISELGFQAIVVLFTGIICLIALTNNFNREAKTNEEKKC